MELQCALTNKVSAFRAYLEGALASGESTANV